MEIPTMPKATFTFRVDDELKSRFADAARAHDRSGAQLLRDFMREYVRRQGEMTAHEAWVRRGMQMGMESADMGDAVAAEGVKGDDAA